MSLPSHLAFEGDGDKTRIVPRVEPVFFDEEGERVDPSLTDRPHLFQESLPQIFRKFLDIIEDGPDKSAAVRAAALRRVAGLDGRPLREAVRNRKFSRTALASAENRIKKKLQIDHLHER